MNYLEIITKLKDERRRLDIAIATLEELDTASSREERRQTRPVGSGMTPEGRQRVSEGMRNYWAKKKSAQTSTEEIQQPQEESVSA